jgi:multidrug efflux pump subunit AcrA (membrane-fusion protein)
VDNNLALPSTDAPARLALPPHDARGDGAPAAAPPGKARVGWKPLAVLAAVAVLVVGLFVAGLVPRLRDRSAARAAATSDEPPRVNVVVARPGAAETALVLPASARADEETGVLARTNGYLEKWLVDIGDRVTDGQLMALIATPEVDQELQQNKATLLQTRASVLQTRATLEQLKATRTLNKQTFDRADAAIKSGVTSSQEFDTAQGNLRTSEANVTAGVAAVGVADANVGVAAANVRRLEDLVAFKRVLAPFAGVVTARNVDTGALISAGQPSSTSGSMTSTGTTNATGAGAAASGQAPGGAQVLFRVARTDPLRIFVNVPQMFTPYVRVGSAGAVRVREFPGRVFPGTVSRTANALDPTARTLTTEVLVRNPDGKLLPGTYVEVKFVQTRPKPPVIVSGGALITRTDGTVVAVVGPGDKLEYRRVEVGRDFGTTAEVVLGLTGGERLVVNMVEELPAGTVVTPVPMPQEPAPKD